MGLTLIETATGCLEPAASRLEHLAVIEGYKQSYGVVDPQSEAVHLFGGDVDVDRSIVDWLGGCHETLRCRRVAMFHCKNQAMAPRRSTILSDFKDFINKGNVVDLAVAVVIGGAFGKVVDAVVSLVMTGVLQPALKAAQVASINAWPAGAVIVALINFVVIAFVVFLIVRAIEAIKRADKAVAPPDTQAQLASAITRLADALDRKAL